MDHFNSPNKKIYQYQNQQKINFYYQNEKENQKNPFKKHNINLSLLNGHEEIFLKEIFLNLSNPLNLNMKKNQNQIHSKIKRISPFNFRSLIKKEISEVLKLFIDLENLQIYSIFNFVENLSQKNLEYFQILKNFEKMERIKFEPVMLRNLFDPSSIEFYWGEFNSLGKKEGFGINLSSNGNFYFGSYYNNKMDGLGLFAFAKKKAKKDNSENFSFYFSKQFYDINKRNVENKIKKNKKSLNDINNKDLNEYEFDFDEKESFRIFALDYFKKDVDYFFYIGEFRENKFEGKGCILDNKENSLIFGDFMFNKIIGEKEIVNLNEGKKRKKNLNYYDSFNIFNNACNDDFFNDNENYKGNDFNKSSSNNNGNNTNKTNNDYKNIFDSDLVDFKASNKANNNIPKAKEDKIFVKEINYFENTGDYDKNANADDEYEYEYDENDNDNNDSDSFESFDENF